jgi:hypothetical protein
MPHAAAGGADHQYYSMSAKEPIDNLVLLHPAAVHGYQTLANQRGPYGITVNNVMPEPSTPTGSSTSRNYSPENEQTIAEALALQDDRTAGTDRPAGNLAQWSLLASSSQTLAGCPCLWMGRIKPLSKNIKLVSQLGDYLWVY